MSNTKRFHKYFKTPGQPLYWIIIGYIILAWFIPVVGLLAKYLPHQDNEDGLKYGDIENTWIIF